MPELNNITLESIISALQQNNPLLLGEIHQFNTVKERIVAYHKQIEKRMDGSSGGVFGAILETLAKEEYYFSGAKFDENLHLHHIVFNNPEQIASITGYKPVQSDCIEAFKQIKDLLYHGEMVVFGGTSLQCYALKKYVGSSENLVTIDFIHTEFVAPEFLDRYALELSEKYGSKVIDIRFYNKEFRDEHAKRITLENGRVYYTSAGDEFDQLTQSGIFTKQTTNSDVFSSLDMRVSDITIGGYKMEKSEDDGLGFAYISANTNKAQEILKKARKRLIVVKESRDVNLSSIRYQKCKSQKDIFTDSLQFKSLKEIVASPAKGKLHKIKKVLGAIKRELEFAHYNPRACSQFFKLNFFNKNVHTDVEHNGFFYVSPYCAFKLPKKFDIELHGALTMGSRRIQMSRQETRLRMEPNSKILVHEGCAWGAGSNIEIYKDALLEVGDLRSNAELTIICGEHITLGSPCNIARNATIRDTSGHLIATPGYQMTKPITIGNHVWVCTESTIMPGVSIGDGSIVGACSFVNKKVPPFTMVQGSPATEVCTIKYFRI